MTCARNSLCRSASYVAAVILFATGCGQSPSGSTTATVAPPTPEESFDIIMAEFKRHVEDTPSGFVTEKGGERSRLLASNKVSSEVIPPANEGDPYRAEVTVVSEARYSLQRKVEEPDESSNDNERDKKSNSDLSDGSTDNGLDMNMLDSGLVKSPGTGSDQGARESKNAGESIITRREEKDKKTFELEYKDGRWQLLTTPDPDTERAIKFAFDKALATQI
jgi:hypothetical protein